MAKSVILLIILILILLLVAVLSIELRITVSFYTSSEYLTSNSEELYKYSIVINRIFRRDSDTKNKSKSKQKSQQNIFRKTSKLSHILEISDISIIGNISLANAFATALSVGILNSAAGIFVAFLSANCSKISLSKIMIQPIYSEEIQGDIFFECIVKANAGNIIVESLKLFLIHKKQERKYKKCQIP